ncbi:MAG: protein kinase [Vicinamibacterales bacterium]
MSFGEALVGQLVDARYRLTRVIGEGGFGQVFEADHLVDTRVLRRVALKLIPHRRGGDERQYDELKHGLNLSHPNVVRCYSCGDSSVQVNGRALPVLFVAMELAEATLADRLKQSRLGHAEAMDVARGVAAALTYLLDRQLSHRDIKPSNVLRVEGQWKLGDFGVSAPLDAGQTAAGDAAGTLVYQAPESVEGQVSPAGDSWSLGVTLLEALTGQRPFDAGSVGEWLYLLKKEQPKVPPGLPEPFDRIIEGCLQRDRKQRLTPAKILSLLENRPESLEQESKAYCVVAPTGGNYQSVVDAVREAAPWSRVLVRPGTYMGQILLNKPLELIAVGASTDVVLDGDATSALVIDTVDAMVRGFSLRMSGASSDAPAVIEVRSGQSMIDLCEVSAKTTACLHVGGRTARPIVRRCRFIGGQHEGVIFDEDAEGTLEACQIVAAPRTGVVIRDKANPVIRRCELQRTRFRGLHCGTNARGVVEDCHIEGGAGPAIEVSRGAQPMLRRVRVVAGADFAIQAGYGAKAIVTGCSIDAPNDRAWKLASGHQVQRL